MRRLFDNPICMAVGPGLIWIIVLLLMSRAGCNERNGYHVQQVTEGLPHEADPPIR